MATSEDEGRFVAVRPPRPFGFKTKRGFVGSRSHDVTVDCVEERLDDARVHGVPAEEFVRGLEPVDAPVLSSDEAVEARGHVDRYLRFRVCHGLVCPSNATASNTDLSRHCREVLQPDPAPLEFGVRLTGPA